LLAPDGPEMAHWLFEDARENARIRDFEVDGVVLGHGWFIEVWVIPKGQVEAAVSVTLVFPPMETNLMLAKCQSMDEGLGNLVPFDVRKLRICCSIVQICKIPETSVM